MTRENKQRQWTHRHDAATELSSLLRKMNSYLRVVRRREFFSGIPFEVMTKGHEQGVNESESTNSL